MPSRSPLRRPMLRRPEAALSTWYRQMGNNKLGENKQEGPLTPTL